MISYTDIPLELLVSISVDRTDPPGFTPGDSTEYRAASGPQVVTCTATGELDLSPTSGYPPVMTVSLVVQLMQQFAEQLSTLVTLTPIHVQPLILLVELDPLV